LFSTVSNHLSRDQLYFHSKMMQGNWVGMYELDSRV